VKFVRIIGLFVVLAGTRMLAQFNPVPFLNQPAVAKDRLPAGLSQTDQATQRKTVDGYGNLPLSFEANQGQTDAEVRFLSRGSGYTLFLTGDEAVFSMQASKALPSVAGHHSQREPVETTTNATLRMKLVKANPAPKVTGEEELPGKSNYFIGNDAKKWRSNVPTYSNVKYEEIYSGIDLVYYGNQRQLEYDFVVAPGANPRRIQFDVRGAKHISRDKHGDLVIRMTGGGVHWRKPLVYQEKGGRRREIDGNYVIRRGQRVGFELAGYDSKRPLIIDPVLGYSTYLGGSGVDRGNGIAVDGSGNAYITGSTESTDFPTTPGTFQTTCNGGSNCATDGDAFVTKLNPSGSALVYSTFLGGSKTDAGRGIAVDSSGNAYVTGSTASADFPVTSGAFQTTPGGIFVTKLNSSGSALVYSTYLGGNSNTDTGQGIAVDGSGNAYVTGAAGSGFPTTSGALQTTCGGGSLCYYVDAFVTKFNASGSALVYSTYLGGSYADIGNGIALDRSGNAYVTGSTASPDFPITPGAFQTSCNNKYPNCIAEGAAFVTELNALGSALVYSTYLGGSSHESASGIAVDSSGNAYVTGQTTSTDFPVTPGAAHTACGGSPHDCGYGDAFVTEFNPPGSALLYSSYLGGSNYDIGYGIAVDGSGNAYVTGYTQSSDFPVTPGAFQSTCGGGSTNCSSFGDAFVTEFNPAGTALLYSTYLGGSADDYGSGIAVDSASDVYVTGSTDSTNFPVTPGAFQVTYAEAVDAFAAKFSSVEISPTSLNFGNQDEGTTSTPQDLTLTNSASASLNITSIVASSDFAQTNNCPVGGDLASGASCMIAVTFTPTATGTRNGAVTITENALGSPQSVPLTGVGLGPVVTLSPSSLNFGIPLKTTSSPQVSTLTNNANATLTITSISVVGANSSDFSEKNNCPASIPVKSSCQITVTFTPSGTGNATASISITDNAANSPQALMLTGVGTDFTVAPSSQTSVTVAPGQAANYSISVGPVDGFNRAVALACSGVPPRSTCTITPSSITIDGVHAASANIAVVTAGSSATLNPPLGGSSTKLAVVLAMLGGVLGFLTTAGRVNGQRKRRTQFLGGLFMLCLVSVVLIMPACGGGSGGGGSTGGDGTPTGTYNVTVTGTFSSGSTKLTHNTSFTLVVQ
jgi:hypothetical protein